jgi:restriction endonuclease Mrr
MNRLLLFFVTEEKDGGIDGTCSLDALGLVKLQFQAKRWKNQVGGKEIRDS